MFDKIPVVFDQFFDNLLSNAVKFTPEGRSIAIHLTENSGRVLFMIQDEGPGISRDMVHKIFDQYSRQTSMMDQELVQDGLGLAIVNKYTIAMNGTVNCKSKLGEGTTFEVELPC
ncbi:MAG: ATP-binding protein [Bacteroidales bacterium]|nr:ATP-binding protein [Bacteroidales bacterium]